MGIAVRVSRRLFLGALLGSVAGQALANAPLTSLRPLPRATDFHKRTARPADTVIAEAKLTGKVGFVVADARTGEVLEARNPLLGQPPASVTKAITALYALDRLGPDFRYHTRLIADGTLRNGRLTGNLALVGSGDPTLDTDALGEMAQQLKASGLREVTGKFLVCGGGFASIRSIDPDQADHVGYNPAISGLNLNYNRVHFEWKRQAGDYTLTLDARARKFAPQVTVAKMRVVDRAAPVYTYAEQGGTDHWTVARGALGKAGSRWLPVRQPELYTAEVFQTLARSHGIALGRGAVVDTPPEGAVLVDHASAPLKEILRGMLKYSTNLTAEVVGLTASATDGSGTRSLRASAEAMNDWVHQELGARRAGFVDHSGLGGASRIAASDMVRALVRVHGNGLLEGILKEISMRDAKGKVIPDHPIRVRAKTGTLNFASALAGYMAGPDGRPLAFAIFAADVPRRNKIRKSDGDIPEGTAAWTARARRMHLQLIERWGTAYGS
ncbi:MAG: D-alanyl-D-alanine carboxypeptidase/D-alanyl-D-alanine-endopeptidase [Rhodobacter sp.]|nr:D-alanyl-D-alanine carboxypeptidase/D-alanyl-D-alanine-endopeptidase [Rhodobacter sp.]